MAELWDLMNKEYLDYNALSSLAIRELKDLDRHDLRFLQIMKVNLATNNKNLSAEGMGHRITSEEILREHIRVKLEYIGRRIIQVEDKNVLSMKYQLLEG